MQKIYCFFQLDISQPEKISGQGYAKTIAAQSSHSQVSVDEKKPPTPQSSGLLVTNLEPTARKGVVRWKIKDTS